jgi:hypothetical protein
MPTEVARSCRPSGCSQIRRDIDPKRVAEVALGPLRKKKAWRALAADWQAKAGNHEGIVVELRADADGGDLRGAPAVSARQLKGPLR